MWWDNHGFGAAVKSGIVPGLLRNYMVLNTGSLMFFSFSLFESGIGALYDRSIRVFGGPEALRTSMSGYLPTVDMDGTMQPRPGNLP
jgi:hypothetical protein